MLAVIIKTFMREEPIFRCVASIKEVLPEARIYIGDDSETISKRKQALYDQLEREGHVILRLPYNTGLPYGRNQLIKLVKEPYVLLCDDDFILTSECNAEVALKTLAENPKMGILGGFLFNEEKEWHYEHNLEIKDSAIYKSSISKDYVEQNGLRLYRADLILNFFFARTEVLRDHPWDDRFVISMEHMDFFLGMKNSPWEVYYSPDIKSVHKPETNGDYAEFRKRTGHWPLFAEKWQVNRICGEDDMIFLCLEEKVIHKDDYKKQTIFRDDDVSLDSDIAKLREIREIFEKHGLIEHYSVVPFGKTAELNQKYNFGMSLEEQEVLTGDVPITENPEVVEFLKESLERGHKIILHGFNHVRFIDQDLDEIFYKLQKGKLLLEKTFETTIEHYASPFNNYNDKLLRVVKDLEMEFLSGEGDMLEVCVKENTPLEQPFHWYHYWRFYMGDLTPQKLDEYLANL